MYLPGHVAVDDPACVLELVRGRGFGHLVVAGEDGIGSTPLPFVVDDDLTTLRAHLARPNPIWRVAPCDALVIVPAGDSYVSPSWYPSKAEHGEAVPTWNYEVVHLHGRLTIHDDPAWLLAHLRSLTDHNESAMPEPWSVDDPPDGFVDRLSRGIVGIELGVERIEAEQKLGQNRPDTDRAGVVEGLLSIGDERGAAAVASVPKRPE